MRIVSVDLQQDFTAENGTNYRPRPCVKFLKQELFPYLRRKNVAIAEIVSDYRLPRPGDENDCCIPGTNGYESEVPLQIKNPDVWVKCMNSPEWTRDNAGVASAPPGLPRPAPDAFTQWLERTIGPAGEAVTLIGLTLDCCVLATALALRHRAYNVSYLVEGVDTYSGLEEEKKWLFKTAALNWGNVLAWNEFQGITIESSRR